MCPPLVIAGVAAAATVGSAVASHSAQNKANKANKEAARKAFLGNALNASALEDETRDKSSRSIFGAIRQARAQRSLAATAAGESGVKGASAEAVLRQIDVDLGEFSVQTERNRDRALGQISRDRKTGRDVMDQRIAAVPPANPFATGLNILGGLAGAGSVYSGLKR